jgi:sulfur-oxidizing protein SoxY
MQRRLFLKNAVAGSVAITALNAGLLTTGSVFAATDEFKAKSADLVSKSSRAGKGSFKFKAPKIAENGAVVPLTIDASKMENVTNISILTKNNTTPLSASFDLSGTATGYVSTRIKMGGTSPVIALVMSNGKAFSIEKEIKVTIGGCGG